MRTKLRLAALLLALLMLLSACTGAGNGTGTDASSEDTTVSVPVDPLDLTAEEGDTAYTVVRSEKASQAMIDSAVKLRNAVKDTLGNLLSVQEDWISPITPVRDCEILIGDVDRDECRTVKAELGRAEYTVRVIGKKIVILGNNDELTAMAVDYFIENVLAANRDKISGDLLYVGKKDYAVKELTINGIGIDDFTVVYTSSYTKNKQIAADLSAAVAELCGAGLPVKSVKESTAEHEIVIGTGSGRGADEKKFGYDDSAVYFENGRLFVLGGSKWSTDVAVNFLLSKLSDKEETLALDLSRGSKSSLEYYCPDRAAYIADPSLLMMHWAYTWDPEEWMIDWNDKVAALNCEDKNHLFTVSHRADWIYYPENSIESIISVWAMGGDCVEIDIHFTRDGIPVVMHDATLTRMTNFDAMKGTNGLPTEANISDWTYEQICQLNLKEGAGGSGAAVTSYKVPSLEEALIACKGRLFIILDKPAEWRYVDIEGMQTKSTARYIYPYMEKTGNFESVLISYGTLDTTAEGTLNAIQAVKIQKYVYEKTGQKMYMFLRGWTSRSTADPYAAELQRTSMTNSAIIVNGAYASKNADAIKNLCKKYPKTLFAGWTIADDTDNRQYWDEMYDIGMRSIMTNNMFGLVKYAAEKK